jgi:uncharacterized membrane protein
MTETSGENLSPAPGAAQQSGLKTTVMVCYVLYLVGFINGLTTIIGVIIAYIKRSDAVGTVWESHFRNLILVFWVMFAAFVVGVATFPVLFYAIATLAESDFSWSAISALAFPLAALMLVYVGLFIWFLYRMIRGLIRAAEDRPF